MSLKSWRILLTVLIRLMGLIALGVLGIAWAPVLVALVSMLMSPNSMAAAMSRPSLILVAVYALPTAAALYMFLSGRWFVDRILRGLARGCPNCGYDTRGLRSGFCPECGVEFEA